MLKYKYLDFFCQYTRKDTINKSNGLYNYSLNNKC